MEIESVDDVLMAKDNFGGIVKQICLQYTPEVQPGDYVLVHVGFALNKVDEEEAKKTYKALDDMDQLDVPEYQDEVIKKGNEDLDKASISKQNKLREFRHKTG